MNPSPAARIPLAVLISGGGTTLRNLLQKIAEGTLPAEIRLVISSNPAAKGLKYAADAGIRTIVAEKRAATSAEEYSAAIFAPCRAAGVELVVMGGFLKHVLIPADFENRVINIHPSLIPEFCGKGMYGHHVHQAVLDAGVRQSGCTVHYVDNLYDHGPILLQRAVPVLHGDTAESLAARVFAAECEALPAAIAQIAQQRTCDSSR